MIMLQTAQQMTFTFCHHRTPS